MVRGISDTPLPIALYAIAMGLHFIGVISRAGIITSLGLISGGVVMNSMVMELPTEKDGRFWPFVTGAAAYTALLLLIR